MSVSAAVRLTARARPGGLILLALGGVLFLSSAAPGGPTTKRVGQWSAPVNQARLQTSWGKLPKPASGDEKAASPKGPILLYVIGVPTKASAKIEKEVFSNTAIVLAARACPWFRVTPDEAADLPYLKSLPRIANPMLIVVGMDQRLHGVLVESRKFTARHCFSLIASAVDEAYEIPLAKYTGTYVKILTSSERLWKEEKKLATLRRRIAAKTGDAKAEAERELQKREDELAGEWNALARQEAALLASLRLEDSPTDDGSARAPADATLSAAERDALRAYRRQVQVKDPILRASALQGLGSLDTPAIARQVLAAARAGDSWTVWRAGEVLSRMRSQAATAVILDALGKGSPRARRAALLSFSERRCDPAIPGILTLAGSGDLDVRIAAVRALGGQAGPETASALLSALHDPNPAVRAVAARAVGRRGLTENAGALHRLSEDRDWCVRKAAIEAMESLRAADSVPHLLHRFQEEPGALRDTCHHALVGITAQPYLYDLEEWRDWWDGAKVSFSPPTLKLVEITRGLVAKARRKEAWNWACEYHSIRTSSRRIVFLVDVGPSMERQMDLPAGLTPGQQEALRSGSKLDLAKRELIVTLGRLDRDDEFNIVAFAGGATAWRTHLTRAANRPSALRWVKKLKAVKAPIGAGDTTAGQAARAGATESAAIPSRTRSGIVAPSGKEHERNVYGALLTAMGILDAQPLRDRSRPEADTIFLVVDGPPSVGELTDVPRLAELVRELNRTRGIVLHVVGFLERTRHLYEPLAVATGGQHVVHGR